MNKLHNSYSQISPINRRKFIYYSGLVLGSTILTSCTDQSQQASVNSSTTSETTKGKLDKVTFGTNWYAQAEHGGFYQAVATDIYRQQGLDVTIKMGGAQVNGTQLLMGGAIDFFMGDCADAIKAVEEGIPKITVAAIFQKDPQVLIAHPGTGNDSLEKLKGKPIFISSAANITFWPFLVSKYNYTEEQKRPYNFNIGPFLADKNAIQQGYVTSEPFKIANEGKFKPVVMLLADYGYSSYSTTIETTKKLVETNPDLVQRFVNGSIKGWASYLQDPTLAHQLIKKDNPEITDEQLAYSYQKIKEYGLVTSGDAEKMGIGAMSAERWKTFFDGMLAAKIYRPNTKYEDAFTLRFVNKNV